MSMENFAEQGGGRRNPDGFRGRQHSYAEFYTADVKGFYLRIVLGLVFQNIGKFLKKGLTKLYQGAIIYAAS